MQPTRSISDALDSDTRAWEALLADAVRSENSAHAASVNATEEICEGMHHGYMFMADGTKECRKLP